MLSAPTPRTSWAPFSSSANYATSTKPSPGPSVTRHPGLSKPMCECARHRIRNQGSFSPCYVRDDAATGQQTDSERWPRPLAYTCSESPTRRSAVRSHPGPPQTEHGESEQPKDRRSRVVFSGGDTERGVDRRASGPGIPAAVDGDDFRAAGV